MFPQHTYNIFQYFWSALLFVGVLCALLSTSNANQNWNDNNMDKGDGLPTNIISFTNTSDAKGTLMHSMDMVTSDEASFQAVVELAIFCDMKFSSIFNYDVTAIRNYWTSYLLDTTLRYRTIVSGDISFLISSLVVLTEHEQQLFIQDAIASDGMISVNRSYELFSKWVYAKMDSLPKFDVAIAVTGLVPNDEGGIVGGIGKACYVDHEQKIHYGSALMVDYGQSYVLVGAHELGHLLGAPHDEELVEFPECSAEKFIMNNGSANNSEQRQYFFSSCSSRLISNFIRSGEAECLQRIDNPESKLSDIKAPSRLEQCKILLPGKKIFVSNEIGFCSRTTCFWYEGEKLEEKSISLVDNTPCTVNGQQCFRDYCIRGGKVLQNAGLKICIRAENQFSSSDKLTVASCSKDQDILTPLEKFAFTPAKLGGYVISTPYSNPNFTKSDEKCLYATQDKKSVLLDQCNKEEESWMIWDLIYNSKGNDFLLSHRITGLCAKLERNFTTVVTTCNSEDTSMMWAFPSDSF